MPLLVLQVSRIGLENLALTSTKGILAPHANFQTDFL